MGAGPTAMTKKHLKICISLLLSVFMLFTFISSPNLAPTRRVYASAPTDTVTAVTELLSAISDSYKNTASDWEALDMAAYGKTADIAAAEIIRNARDLYENGNVTDIARTVIVLTALGIDAGHVYSGNEGVYLNFIGKLGENDVSTARIMDAAFTLIALDSGAYNDAGLPFTRQACIDKILELKLIPAAGQAGWAYTGGIPGVDVTAMVVAALAPYRGATADVGAVIEDALNYMSGQQNTDGYFGDSNATAMAIVALAALGIDPGADSGRFSKNGNSLMEGLLAFRTGNDKFGYSDNSAPNNFSTEQGFRALVAYRGYKAAGDIAYNIYLFGPQTGDGADLTGERDPGAVAGDTTSIRNATVRIVNLCDALELIPQTSVKTSGTHLDAVKAALSANGKNPDADMFIDTSSGYAYIVSILGLGGDDMSKGWMYAINDDSPNESISESLLAEGDSIVMYYMNWNDTVYLTKFDKKTADIIVGSAVTLTLTGADTFSFFGGGAVYEPISGATVYIDGVSGNIAGASTVTGADGRATLSFPDAGVYTVGAKRQGSFNDTDLVPPLCIVTVTSIAPPGSGTGPGTGGSSGYITVNFALHGINKDSGAEEIWINGMTLNNIQAGATVSDVIIKALEIAGYTQNGAASGYVKSVTTPAGFTLSEMYGGSPNAGWLFKVNSQLPEVGMDSYIVTKDDNVLLYYTKDYTADPDAGRFSGADGGTGGTAGAGSPEAGKDAASGSAPASVISVVADVKDGIAAVSVSGEDLRKALKAISENVKNKDDADVVRDITIAVTHRTNAVSVEIGIDLSGLAEIADAKNVRLTLKSGIAAIIMEPAILAAIVKAAGDGAVCGFFFSGDTKILKEAGSTLFDFKITVDGSELPALDGTVPLFLPASLAARTYPELYAVYYADENGEYIRIDDAAFIPERGGYAFDAVLSGTYAIKRLAAEEVLEWDNPFIDVAANDWYYESVKYVYENRIMLGTDDNVFSPEAAMTRAMLLTMLYRLAGEPVVSYDNQSIAVTDVEWYTEPVIWAYETGVSIGDGGDVFGVNDYISRERLITMLYNFVKLQNDDFTFAEKAIGDEGSGLLSAYTGADEISEWAFEAMAWAVREGLILGDEDAVLAPLELTTRAQVAAVFTRYLSYTGE